jgi:hypothetical protein
VRPAAAAILQGGLAAATLDLAYAVLRQLGRGRDPEWTLQLVASGWLGQDAFAGGAPAAILGFVSHYGIVLAAAAAYWLAGLRLRALRTRPVASGAAFGIAVYLVMNFLVLPLSAFPFDPPHPPLVLLEGFVSHALLVGLPIALVCARHARRLHAS